MRIPFHTRLAICIRNKVNIYTPKNYYVRVEFFWRHTVYKVFTIEPPQHHTFSYKIIWKKPRLVWIEVINS